MRRRKFEVVSYMGIGVHTNQPGAIYSVIDKRNWLAKLLGYPGRTRYNGNSPADCYQWIERYRQVEKDVAAFNG